MADQVNTATREWRIVSEWAEQRLAEHVRTLEKYALDDRSTTYLRGRITELRGLLALGAIPTLDATHDALAPGDTYE